MNYYKKNVTIINTYTYKYKDAPKAVRGFYEDECRANRVKPKDNDTIEITEDTLKRLQLNKINQSIIHLCLYNTLVYYLLLCNLFKVSSFISIVSLSLGLLMWNLIIC